MPHNAQGQNQNNNNSIINHNAISKDNHSYENGAFRLEETGGHTDSSIVRRKSSNSNTLEIVPRYDGSLAKNHGDAGGGHGGGNGALDFNKEKANGAGAEQQSLDFDDMLPLIGEFGRYQKILFLLMIPFSFFVAFVYFNQIFITLVPEQHWCHVPELENLTQSERLALSIPRMASGEYANCEMYAVNYTELMRNGTKTADPKWPRTSCQFGWSYNFTDLPYTTIATEQNWVCENAALPTYAQSIFFLGAIVGGLLFGWVADRFGRVPALIGCNMMGFIAGIATAFATNFWQFALMRFFVGFAFDNCFTMMYILVLEYVGPRYRTFVANMSIAIFFTMAACLIPWIAYFIADWKIFIIVTSAPLFLSIFTPIFVPESARWLVSQGRFEKAVLILKKLEKANGKHVPNETFNAFTESCQKMQQAESQNQKYSILDLFKTPRLRRTTILLIIIWMAISLVFDGHVRNVDKLGLDIFLTFTVASFTEFPADTLLTLTLDRWGRRALACGTMVASGVFSLLATVVPSGTYSASLAIAGRFFVNISYNIGLQYAAEILPTVVRAQGVAFIHIMGYVANIIVPFIVYLSKISPMLPLIILGVMGICGGLLTLFLPETLNHDLPQTLADGENFGRDQGMCDFPCIGNGDGRDDEHFDSKHQGSDHFVRSTQTGASLNASTRGEIRSSILRRSVRSRYSTKL